MIVGMNINSIKAEVNREKIPEGSINVGSTPKIENVTKKDIDILGLKNVLFINFSFDIKYEPGIGNIDFKGDVLYQGKDAEKMLKKWEKEKKLEDSASVEILNAIFRKCLTKAVDIAVELSLPPPVAFPVVKPKETKDEYIG
jgi:hypothetical protein